MTLLKSIAGAAGAAALFILPTGVLAQGMPMPSTDPSSVLPGAYKLESSHARIVWRVSHMAFSEWYGDFAGATGTAVFDPKAPSVSSVDISIPTASVTTTNAILDGELKSPAWFGADAYPTITFKSTTVVPTGPGTADVIGALTFHGVTKPVTLKVKFRAAGFNGMTKRFTAGFDATAAIKRSDFGVKTYVPMIGDDVEINISAPFEKQG
jgi:polyisoprenoid-binding protein YceI